MAAGQLNSIVPGARIRRIFQILGNLWFPDFEEKDPDSKDDVDGGAQNPGSIFIKRSSLFVRSVSDEKSTANIVLFERMLLSQIKRRISEPPKND